MLSLYLLDTKQPDQSFPSVDMAWDEPNGLLAVGGDLSVTRLANAYRHGIFPWFGPREPIYWWSPNPRAVIYPQQVRITRSLRKALRNRGYQIRFDQNFAQVVRACAAPRSYTNGTWITTEMFKAYCALHDTGLAHSVEVYDASGTILVGGLYGVATGGVFCGESMFSLVPDASKIALIALAYYLHTWGFALIDCQIPNPHLMSMGAVEILRNEFVKTLAAHPDQPPKANWQIDPNVDLSRWEPQAATLV